MCFTAFRHKSGLVAFVSVGGLVLLVLAALPIAGCYSGAKGATQRSSTTGNKRAAQTPAGGGSQEKLSVSSEGERAEEATGNPESSPSSGKSAGPVSALETARGLRGKGQAELATYYYLNAINTEPRDANVLREYGECVEEIVRAKEKEGKKADAAEMLEKLASVFYGQALHVDWKSIETVVSKATAYQEWAEKLRQEQFTSPASGVDHHKWEELKEKLTAGQAPAVPEALEAAEEELRELEPLLLVARENPTPEDEEAITWFENHVRALQAVVAFHRGKSIVNEYLNRAKCEDSPIVSGMILQQAELTLRELADVKASLPPALANEVTDLTRQLNAAAVEASNRQAKETSEKAWEEFRKEKNIDSQLSSIRGWQPRDIKEDGACSRKLEELEALMREIQAMVPLLSDFETREKAVDLMEDLTKEGERISKARQNRYCRWALDQIQTALEMYEKNKGWINDNEIEFGKALIDQLGQVDESLLTFETRRCFSEAFETICGELGGVESADL